MLDHLLTQAQLLTKNLPKDPFLLPQDAETFIINASEFLENFLDFVKELLTDCPIPQNQT